MHIGGSICKRESAVDECESVCYNADMQREETIENTDSGEEWGGEGYETAAVVSDPVLQAARDIFGVKYLFPWQRLVIADILETAKGDAERKCAGRVVLLPTGAGKSLCFMVPSVLLDGPTLIIYPLLALMADQERRLKAAGVDCVILKGDQSAAERLEAYNRMKNAHIIITNPEMLCQEGVIRRLMECNVKHIAIDEAHCAAEWGDSFRPAYLELGKVIKMLAAPVVTAFTATASGEVLRRMAEVLFADERANIDVIRSDADRQNIHYFVLRACDKMQAALHLTCTEKKPMLIFCSTRVRAENMARDICTLHGHEAARFYHAGMTKEERKEIENWFFNSKDGILAATCAYGMGVDKKNIRTVIHLDAPVTAEAYLQEAGRGGRDGEEMNAILIFSPSDMARFEKYPPSSRERIMMHYAAAKGCRRQVLLNAIGGEEVVCSGCDNCGKHLTNPPAWDGGVALRLALYNSSRYTKKEFQRVLIGKMNSITRKAIGYCTWNEKAARLVMKELLGVKAVRERRGLWNGRIAVTGEWKALIGDMKPRHKKTARKRAVWEV